MTVRPRPVDQQEDLPEFLSDTVDDVTSPRRETMRNPTATGHVPGEIGIWVFILGDMTVFAALLTMMMWQLSSKPALVSESARHLGPGFGFFNTLVLLVSSYLVVLAVHAHRRDAHKRVRTCVAAAIGCAAMFATIKAVEYAHEIGAGYTPNANVFFNYYYALTGLHLLHVMVGTALLTWWWAKAKRRRTWSSSSVVVESVAVYWHMVDLLWIAIFTLAYLVCAQ
jgi:nitric oxide reductase NorE protein